jgi:hypothetical protein
MIRTILTLLALQVPSPAAPSQIPSPTCCERVQSEVEPDLVADFSSYASIDDIMADLRFNRGETFPGGEHGRIVIDEQDGYDGRGRSLRYEWSAVRSPSRGGTLSVQLDVPDVSEIWVEWSAKFSRGYAVDFGFTGGAAYKFLFLNINNPPSGRIGVGFEGRRGSLTFHGPDDVIDVSHADTGLDLLGSLNDGRWHVYRIHARLTPRGDEVRVWVDGRKVGTSLGWNSAAQMIRGITLGRNMNMAPTRPQWNSWGHVHAWWTEDPGWR